MAARAALGEATVTHYAGLKASCRHITAQDAVADKIRFVVGTVIVGKANQLQIIEYDEMQATIQCVQTLAHADELWWICCHPNDSDLLFTISQKSTARLTTTSLYRIPPPDTLAQALGSQEHQALELIATFRPPDPIARRVFLLPEDERRCVVACLLTLNVFDVERPDVPATSVPAPDVPFTAASPDPIHSNTHIVAAGCGPSVKLWDIRSNKFDLEIPNAHMPDVLDVAFNPNKPWWLCTGGSDGFLRCWDARNPTAAAEYRASSHWVTRTIPSLSHEQLILTTGTDSKVRVFNSGVFAFQQEGKLREGKIIESIRQDDSVYCATWAAHNPWVFASVSYKGQVDICQLPSQVVDSILMGEESD
jgi:WD40 repeat protein